MRQSRLDIKPSSSTFLQTYAYNSGSEALVQGVACTFDNVGNITGAANTASAFGTLGGPYANHYYYDDIDRLTGSTQSYGTGNTLAASYSPSGRMCGRSQTFNGQHAIFGYDDNDKPHAPRRIFEIRTTIRDLLWDQNGNLAQVNTHDSHDGSWNSSRHLLWTEDSRLSGVVDMQSFSYYSYDHGGERVLKMTGSNNMLDVNANYINYSAVVENVTLYPSPYLVADNKGYTKHYYAGTERLCARIGDGGLNHNGDFVDDDNAVTAVSDELFTSILDASLARNHGGNLPEHISGACNGASTELAAVLERVPTSANITASLLTSDFESAMLQYAPASQQGEEAYFYHGDHLGSASWITDAAGTPVQHLQYLPFGEPFVNQRTTGYDERFTFTGKERDEETGYGYFGARYMDHELMTMWLSVDPMCDKYPSISPYAYCAWNPLKLVDPDGNIPIRPFVLVAKGVARGVEFFSRNSDIKTVAYSVNHPIIAIKVGKAIDGGTNGISSFSSNYAINMSNAANLSMDGEGSSRNAIRHTLWQAILTDEFGINQAERIGNNHETGAKVDYSKRVFSNIEEADRLCYLLNNEIGRSIGKQNKDADNATMAKKVADTFYHSGLWTVSENSGNNFKIQKTKISKLEYSKMINEIKKLNNNGLHE